MEVIYTAMSVAVAMSSLLLYLIAKITRVFSKVHPIPQLAVQVAHSHNCPTGTRQQYRRNSVNLTASTHNQHRPQENDERFCQTVGKLDRLIKNLILCPFSFDLKNKTVCVGVKGSKLNNNSKFTNRTMYL